VRLEISIHVHHHSENESRIERKLDQLKETIMATLQQFMDGFARVEAATTEIAADIKMLVDQLASGGLTTEQEEAVLAKLLTHAATLEGMAASVESPVPEPPA
jgi:uncharacterized protein (UPF0335 family)